MFGADRNDAALAGPELQRAVAVLHTKVAAPDHHCVCRMVMAIPIPFVFARHPGPGAHHPAERRRLLPQALGRKAIEMWQRNPASFAFSLPVLPLRARQKHAGPILSPIGDGLCRSQDRRARSAGNARH